MPPLSDFQRVYHGFEHRGLRLELDPVNSNHDRVAMLFVIYTETGRRVGHIWRYLFERDGELYVRKEVSRIDAAYQRRGFSTALALHDGPRLMAVGVKHASLYARDEGAAVWGKLGSDFDLGLVDEQDEARKRARAVADIFAPDAPRPLRPSALRDKLPARLRRRVPRRTFPNPCEVLEARERAGGDGALAAKAMWERIPSEEQIRSGSLEGIFSTPKEITEFEWHGIPIGVEAMASPLARDHALSRPDAGARLEPLEVSAPLSEFQMIFHGFEHAGMRVEVDTERSGGGDRAVCRVMEVEGGRHVGHIVRRLQRKDGMLRVWMDFVELEPEFRRRGFQTALRDHAIPLYIQLGVSALAGHAGWRGGAVWGALGGDFDLSGVREPDEARKRARVVASIFSPGALRWPVRENMLVDRIRRGRRLLDRLPRKRHPNPHDVLAARGREGGSGALAVQEMRMRIPTDEQIVTGRLSGTFTTPLEIASFEAHGIRLGQEAMERAEWNGLLYLEPVGTNA